MDTHDTIAAVATPLGQGGIGVIKISGARAGEAAASLFRRKHAAETPLKSHCLHLGEIINPSSREVVDEVLVAFMPAPASYTREDVVEIQCHSGFVVLERILSLVLSLGGIRLAEPGEFTRRAFLNGRLDLTQAEAIADLVGARTASALEQAAAQLGGALSEKISHLKKRLLDLIAQVESALDFPEEDCTTLSQEEIRTSLLALRESLSELISTYDEGRLFREGVHAAIIGRPNVGKSSLLNALLGEERAIVSHVPGTTRDTIEESISIGGIALTFADTAGLLSTPVADPVESLGTQRARAKASEAELVLFVLDQSVAVTEVDVGIFQEFQHKPIVVVCNKADLPPFTDPVSIPAAMQGRKAVAVSAKYHQGIDALQKAVQELILRRERRPSSPVFINRLRHQRSVIKAAEHLDRALKAWTDGISMECAALDLKLALECMGEVVGETATEDILDQIFAEFCIGK